MRWFLSTHTRRLWLIAVLGISGAFAFSSLNQPIVGDLIEDLVFLAGAVAAVAGLLGHGPLREKPATAEEQPRPASGNGSVDKLVRLADLWRTGQMDDKEFEAAKKRILGS